jgi:HAD superfamily hydrolase (TIGR01509 family)
MIEENLLLAPVDLGAVQVVMCDADGTLFDSEGPAFEASTTVTNRLLATWGIDRTFTPDALRQRALGRNFRSTALELAAEAGVSVESEALERWVVVERQEVVAQLSASLRPAPGVRDVLSVLSRSLRLCIVTSSARSRLDACLRATDLEDLFPDEVRFSAEDSLPLPTTKPDPAIYRFAGERMHAPPGTALAIEDAVAGVRSAVAAGFATIGNLHFVPDDEREARVEAFREAGVAAVVPSWFHLARLLATAPTVRRAPTWPAAVTDGN